MKQSHDRHLRIVYVVKGLGAGGAERWVMHASRWFIANGDKVWVINLNSRRAELKQSISDSGASVVDFDLFGKLFVFEAIRLIATLIKIRPSIIHSHLPLAGVISRIISRIINVPSIYTEHSIFSMYHPATKIISRMTYFLEKEIVAVSNATKSSVVKNIGIKYSDLRVIENPVSTGLTTEPNWQKIRISLNFRPEDLIIGTVASFRPVKRLDLLVLVFSEVHKRYKNTKLLLVGTGPQVESLKAYVDTLDLRDHVIFAGFQPNPNLYMELMDIYVLCSAWEGLPMALLEAMSLGKAVVASRVGGVPEVISSMDNGILVNPERTEDLLESIIYLVNSPKERLRLGESARMTIGSKYSIASVMERYREIYNQHFTKSWP